MEQINVCSLLSKNILNSGVTHLNTVLEAFVLLRRIYLHYFVLYYVYHIKWKTFV